MGVLRQAGGIMPVRLYAARAIHSCPSHASPAGLTCLEVTRIPYYKCQRNGTKVLNLTIET